MTALKSATASYSDVRPEDLFKFGLIPEFIGRLPVITTVEHLDKDALVRVLTEPKNALLKQYQKMFQMDGVALSFDQSALEAIAELAIARETGARGLRSILEETLGGVMFDLPSRDDVAEVVITRATVIDREVPTLLSHAMVAKRDKKSA